MSYMDKYENRVFLEKNLTIRRLLDVKMRRALRLPVRDLYRRFYCVYEPNRLQQFTGAILLRLYHWTWHGEMAPEFKSGKACDWGRRVPIDHPVLDSRKSYYTRIQHAQQVDRIGRQRDQEGW